MRAPPTTWLGIAIFLVWLEKWDVVRDNRCFVWFEGGDVVRLL
jgi:hypothetical protein